MQSGESDSDSFLAIELPDSFRNPQISEVWSPPPLYKMPAETTTLRQDNQSAQEGRRRRKQLAIRRHKPTISHYDHSMPTHNQDKLPVGQIDFSREYSSALSGFEKRRMLTTIHEESFHINKYSFKNSPSYKSLFSKSKGYQEKVSSLKTIVGRLQKMCLEKPEMLQDSIPDETIKLFKSIHL